MKGLSQKEVALAVGVSRPTVSDWANNKKDPRGENLSKLAKLFDVSWHDIIVPKGETPAWDDRPQTGLTDADIEAVAKYIMKQQEQTEPQEDETWALRERYRRDPNYRLLFDAAERATPEHLRAAAAMLKALEGTTDD